MQQRRARRSNSAEKGPQVQLERRRRRLQDGQGEEYEDTSTDGRGGEDEGQGRSDENNGNNAETLYLPLTLGQRILRQLGNFNVNFNFNDDFSNVNFNFNVDVSVSSTSTSTYSIWRLGFDQIPEPVVHGNRAHGDHITLRLLSYSKAFASQR